MATKNLGKVVGADGKDGVDGVSPVVTVAENTSTTYTLNITDKSGTITTPNLKGKDGSGGSSYDDTEVRSLIAGNTLEIETKQEKTEKIILTKAQAEGGYAFLDNKDYVVSEGVSTLVISSATGSGSMRFATLSGFALDVGSLKIVGEHTFEENTQYDIAYIDGWVYVSQGVAI